MRIRITLRLARTAINIDGQLSPGMNLTAEIKTGKRRIIEYLLSPIQRATSESLCERWGKPESVRIRVSVLRPQDKTPSFYQHRFMEKSIRGIHYTEKSRLSSGKATSKKYFFTAQKSCVKMKIVTDRNLLEFNTDLLVLVQSRYRRRPLSVQNTNLNPYLTPPSLYGWAFPYWGRRFRWFLKEL